MYNLISLGDVCQVAYQINRHTNQKSGLFYDWLITKNDTYKSIFLDADQYFSESNIIISENKEKVIDTYTGIEFLHEFPKIENSKKLNEVKVQGHLEIAKAKFTYLKHKTLNTIKSSDTPYLIRRVGFQDVETVNEVAEKIRADFLYLNSNLKVVIVCSGLKENTIDENILTLKIVGTKEWTGDDTSWNHVFDQIDKHYFGFKK